MTSAALSLPEDTLVLGLESSCDETAAAVLAADGRILAQALSSQFEAHAPFGGVVPEIAARAHLDVLDVMVAGVMKEAGCGFKDLSAIAATSGPGLIGGVLVGAMTAKTLAAIHSKPYLAINHLEAHALTIRLTDGVAFPYLLLLISGGHCELVIVEGVGRYTRLGATVDDAAGEAFDKVAKMLGLGFPGGPAVETAAQHGDPARFAFPRPMMGRDGFDFSFSGLKTAVRHAAEALPEGPFSEADLADLAASFQAAVADSLADRTAQAAQHFLDRHPDGTALVVAGGVAANATLRTALTNVAEQSALQLIAPPPKLCTDNAVMIAWAGLERLALGQSDPLDFKPRPRWPLDALSA